MRFVPPSMAGHFAVHGKMSQRRRDQRRRPDWQHRKPAARSVRPKLRIRLVTRTSARMSIYKPENGAVLAGRARRPDSDRT
jgi:hypothetical protein